MDFPSLKLESRFAKLGLNNLKGEQSIEQPPAEITIEQPHAELLMETIKGKLSIDQSKAWEDMDLKSIFKRIEEFAQNGFQDNMEGIARTAQQGDQLMKIENKNNMIAIQAESNSRSKEFEFNIGWVPSHFSVNIAYEAAKLNIDWKQNTPVINVKVNRPNIEYYPGKVEGEMLQYPELRIEVVGLYVNAQK
ncbi:hypothetical protein ABID52_000599 [Fictibacillus halophilus]|uniref:Uncharacterized protein n=1 Tax=Fictibacillus halophilus TaxID=1610490 RepID=A0ABV2LEJ6_9BACL|nr:DUF6470 family protein [Fictibacillus halophilus]